MSHQVRVIDGLRFDRIPFDELFAGNEPVLMRGLTADWPLVQAAPQVANQSDGAARRQLQQEAGDRVCGRSRRWAAASATTSR